MPVVINSDGISVSFATKLVQCFHLVILFSTIYTKIFSHFGPFVLTNTLMPLLKQAAEITGDARVVTV